MPRDGDRPKACTRLSVGLITRRVRLALSRKQACVGKSDHSSSDHIIETTLENRIVKTIIIFKTVFLF